YGWHVLTVDGHDVAAVEEAVKAAQAETTRPSLIITKTKIGWGTPLEGTSKAHSDPMGPENIAALKAKIGWPEEPFYVPGEVREFFAARKEELARQSQEWKERFEAWSKAYPELRAEWDKAFGLELPENLDEILPEFEPGEKVATRSAGGTVLQVLAKRMPYLVGGSADLHPSTKTFIEGGGVITRDDYSGRNIHFGVREHAMGAMLNGMQLHGGLRVFGSTFLVFSDYMRPTIRLAALMRQPVVFVFTHDSVYVGEDGPTHQPVEQAESLRLIPNVEVYRPADAVEAALAWVEALRRKDGPTVLLFTRQNVPVLEREEKADLSRGAYVIKREKHPLSAVILASGSEVSLALEAAQKLEQKGRGVRVVSVPNRELFLRQDAGYQEAVAPKGTPRLVVEAGVGAGWRGLAGENGRILSIERFGVSAPGAQAAANLRLTVDRPVALVEEMLQAG